MNDGEWNSSISSRRTVLCWRFCLRKDIREPPQVPFRGLRELSCHRVKTLSPITLLARGTYLSVERIYFDIFLCFILLLSVFPRLPTLPMPDLRSCCHPCPPTGLPHSLQAHLRPLSPSACLPQPYPSRRALSPLFSHWRGTPSAGRPPFASACLLES